MLQKTDICYWIFRDHWNFDLLFRLTRAKLCDRYEMVSFFIHKLTVYCWTRHCCKIRANMATCWAMSMKLQDIVTRTQEFALRWLIAAWSNADRSFVTRSFLFHYRFPCAHRVVPLSRWNLKFHELRHFYGISKYISLNVQWYR